MKKALISTRNFSICIILIMAALYFASGVYSVPQNQMAVHQRFGRVINSTVSPGMHYALPWPIDKIDKVSVKEHNKRIVISDFIGSVEGSSEKSVFEEATGLSPCCISGDNNIVNILCTVQYSISNPDKYLFHVVDNEALLRGVVCNAMIKCLSRLSIDEILTSGKREIECTLKINSQSKLSELGCGLTISSVELRSVQPPSVVQSAFDDVINAKIDKRKIISQAESYRNENIPNANAEANRMIQRAQAYKIETISKAQGQTQRFLEQLKAYQNSKEITKKRLYMEFIKEISPAIKKAYIVDKNEGDMPANIKIFSGN